jgi:hypothetical protein
MVKAHVPLVGQQTPQTLFGVRLTSRARMNVGIGQATEMNKDMEFRLLAIYYTGRLAFSFDLDVAPKAAIFHFLDPQLIVHRCF